VYIYIIFWISNNKKKNLKKEKKKKDTHKPHSSLASSYSGPGTSRYLPLLYCKWTSALRYFFCSRTFHYLVISMPRRPHIQTFLLRMEPQKSTRRTNVCTSCPAACRLPPRPQAPSRPAPSRLPARAAGSPSAVLEHLLSRPLTSPAVAPCFLTYICSSPLPLLYCVE
jgi:hypothetical protein